MTSTDPTTPDDTAREITTPHARAARVESTSSSVGNPPLVAILLAMAAAAVNLRLAIADIPPLLDVISREVGLNSALGGLLTTLPVLCMGLLAPLAQRISARFGAVPAIAGAVACCFLGSLLRFGAGHLVVLYLSTLVAGAGIAVCGTLLPSLVKSFFPAHRSGAVTGVYMFAMMGGAAAASALTVPIADASGSWQVALGVWSLIGLLGLIVWVLVMRRAHRPPRPRGVPAAHSAGTDAAVTPRGRLPFRQSTAWLIAGYLTLQSWCFYSSLAWLAPTYVHEGWSRADAGFLLSVFTGAQFVSGLIGPAMLDRVREQRLILVPAALCSLAGCTGVFLAPDGLPWVWAVFLGLGQGAAFALGLVLLVSYAATSEASSRLSAMAFLVSYSIASLGPLVMGVVRDHSSGFGTVWLVLAIVACAQTVVAASLSPHRRTVH